MALAAGDTPIHEPGYRNTKGSALMMFQFRNINGTVTSDTTWYLMPDTKDSEISDDTAKDSWENESGFERSADGKQAVMLTGNFAQTDRATKRLFAKVLRNKRILVVKEMSVQSLDGIFDYELFFGKPDPTFKYKTPNGDVPYSITGEALASSLSLDISTITNAGTFFSAPSGSWTGTWTIPRGQAYEIFSLS